MTNQEAYINDLDDLRKEIDYLLSMVPVGKTKKNSKLENLPKMRLAEPEPPLAA